MEKVSLRAMRNLYKECIEKKVTTFELLPWANAMKYFGSLFDVKLSDMSRLGWVEILYFIIFENACGLE